MPSTELSSEQISVYRDYRTPKRHLRAGREFADWMKIARGYDQARREAMRDAHTNRPQGSAYREHFARIDRREKLIDRDDQGREFPTKEDRSYCIKVIENYDVAAADSRRRSIKAWRDGLSAGERANLNHPKRVWTAYWAATEPRAETEARRVERERREPERSPMLDLVADTEHERDAARRQIEALRELLAAIRAAVELPEAIAARIDAVLRGG
jgi:hypothetical protein